MANQENQAWTKYSVITKKKKKNGKETVDAVGSNAGLLSGQ